MPASTRPADSWIEIASRPSSSSLSSASDDIVTTGLRVQPSLSARQRRRQATASPLRLNLAGRDLGADTSSQDEYEESESESDRVMTSSNEALPPTTNARSTPYERPSSTSSGDMIDEEDEDESGTALGIGMQQAFTPQPNAFSHPPCPLPSDSYFPQSRPAPRPSAQRHSYPARQSHSPYSAINPAHQADHDAALRASLSTLLSCAAAARGLPKSNATAARPQQPARVEPSTLRMVPESELLGTRGPVTRRQPSPSTSCDEKKNKRRPSSRSSSKERARALKKLRSGQPEEGTVSPTLMTWVVSAGVLVLVSALSFSAGYSIGREAGNIEAGWAGAGHHVVDGGQEATRGSLSLRRLRWTDAASAIKA